MARTKVNIDWERIEKMAMAGANGQQIAAAIGVHYDTLVNRYKETHSSDFSQYLQAKREKGNELLLRKQYEIAMTGDRTMLVWLGKQRLGQREKQDTDITTGGEKLNEIKIIWPDGD
jgi:hypothetical protein